MKTKVGNTLEKIEGKVSLALQRFFRRESTGGLFLMGAAFLAIIAANSTFAGLYDHFLHMEIGFDIGDFSLRKSSLHWINDGLMAIFFFLIGLEVKREFVRGELSDRSRAILPGVAAIGGMAVPALVFVALNFNNEVHIHGWAIPAATDIAFALGVLALLGSRVPVTLKILLTAIAVMDDIGAVIIIALFYTSDLSMNAVYGAAFCILLLFALFYRKSTRTSAYILVGMLLWFAVLKSGVHATLAGVVTALFIPLDAKDKEGHAIAEKLEHRLHPWVAFAIMPLFAFANAGIPLDGLDRDILFSTLTIGIFAGLFIGKQLGIFSAIWLATKFGLASKPHSVTWRQLYGLSVLCGIGFTMSLFIGNLAFSNQEMATSVRLGVISGSVASALLGTLVLFSKKPPKPAKTIDEEKTIATEEKKEKNV
jgi:NhaA family Na+:H+ antiporter